MARDRALGKLARHVLRVAYHDVFGDLDVVIARITDTARSLVSRGE